MFKIYCVFKNKEPPELLITAIDSR